MKSQQISKQICSLQAQIRALPDGKLVCSHNGDNYKWYHSDDHKHTYIPKKNRKYAEQLAIKKYLSAQLEDLANEKSAIHSYLSHFDSSPSKAEELLDQNPEIRSLLAPYFSPSSVEATKWANEPYPRNPLYPEQLIHKTSSGHMVRSKSEVLIDMILTTNRIPFRYECELQLPERTIYPDFTIRNPRTGNILYWEHFGQMDNPEYARKTIKKLNTYISNNIIPNINLITTYETKDHPLSISTLDHILSEYLS